MIVRVKILILSSSALLFCPSLTGQHLAGRPVPVRCTVHRLLRCRGHSFKWNTCEEIIQMRSRCFVISRSRLCGQPCQCTAVLGQHCCARGVITLIHVYPKGLGRDDLKEVDETDLFGIGQINSDRGQPTSQDNRRPLNKLPVQSL
jgi:hypothetical protein